jgi:hypothetical protein
MTGPPDDLRREAAEAAASAYRRFAADVAGTTNGDGAEAGSHDGADGDAGPATGHEDDPFGIGDLRRSMTRALDLYLELAERVFDVSTRSLEQALGGPLAAMAGPRVPSAQPVRLEAPPGGRATATIWLHNVTGAPLATARLLCSDLLGDDGSTLPASAATFEPGWSGPVVPFATVSATLVVAVPASAAPAVYVGHAVLVGAPDVAVPLRLTVEGPRLPS